MNAMSNLVDERRAERGSALITVLVLLTGLLILAYAFSRSVQQSQSRASASYDDQRAFDLAEAGLHEGMEATRAGLTGNVGSMDAPAALGGGVLWVEATDLGGDRRRLVSTALVGGGRQALEAVVHVQPAKAPIFVAT